MVKKILYIGLMNAFKEKNSSVSKVAISMTHAWRSTGDKRTIVFTYQLLEEKIFNTGKININYVETGSGHIYSLGGSQGIATVIENIT